MHPDVETVTGDDDHLTAAGIDELLVTSTSAVVVGVGNVALDVARVLIKSADQLDDTDMADEVLESLAHKQISQVHILGRRGPAYTSFTTKELRELGQLPDVDVIIDPADLVARRLQACRHRAEQDRGAQSRRPEGVGGRTPTGATGRIHFHFWTRPTKIIGTDRVAAVEVERTMINSDGYVVGAGPTSTITAQLIIRSVGYRGVVLPGVPFDESTGRVPHADGRVIRDGGFSADEYVTGWIKRGPTGVIGTNKSDAVETVTSLLADVHDGAVHAHGRSGDLDQLLAGRGIHALDMPAWHRIDAAEIELGSSHGRVRTTLAHRHDLLAAAEDGGPGNRESVISPDSGRVGFVRFRYVDQGDACTLGCWGPARGMSAL